MAQPRLRQPPQTLQSDAIPILALAAVCKSVARDLDAAFHGANARRWKAGPILDQVLSDVAVVPSTVPSYATTKLASPESGMNWYVS